MTRPSYRLTVLRGAFKGLLSASRSPVKALVASFPLWCSVHAHSLEKHATHPPHIPTTTVNLPATTPFSERSSLSIARLLKSLPKQSAQRVRDWLRLVDQNRLRPMATKLKAVNEFFNSLAYMTDQDMWNLEDYWATPLEVIANGKGDCEDLAIAKYFTLRAMGVSSQQLGISYVKSYRLPTAHMVLDYYESREGRPVTLDNLDNNIRERPDLNAIYSFNEDHVWASHNRASNVGSPSDIRHWLMLQEKLSDQLLF